MQNAVLRAFQYPRTGKFPEKKNYLNTSTKNGNAVSYELLQLRAREIMQSLNITENELKASKGWIKRFMKGKNLSLRSGTSLCQKLPSDFTDKAIALHHHVIRIRQAKYILSQIGDTDQSPVFFHMPGHPSSAERFISCFHQNVRPILCLPKIIHVIFKPPLFYVKTGERKVQKRREYIQYYKFYR
jgi:hypothetical protein